MSDNHLISPKAAIPLNAPESSATVKVSCIDTTSRFRLPMSSYLQPDYVGMPDMKGPSYAFLIEHPSRTVLFDLGIRSDWHNLPSYPKFVELKWDIRVEKDVATILTEHKVDVKGGAVGEIIFSHHHWDHTGKASLFPTSTDIVVGPGFVEAFLPGYPARQDSLLLQSDFEGRQVREISFDEGPNAIGKIGRFKAYDYFGDGSFYLLDTPGHSIGHMCGFARTSLHPNTFVFMGGDACHHGGEFKPNAYTPLPRTLSPSPLKRYSGACPGHILQDVNAHKRADQPFYYVTESFAHEKKVADWTVEGLGEFDADPHVLMVLAHEGSILDPPQLDFYPRSLNNWFAEDKANKIRWLFLRDFEEAVSVGEKGADNKPFSWGKYP